jgi:hypothetical protein
VYSIEFAVFLVPLKQKRWAIDTGKQARMWSVVIKAGAWEFGMTLAVNLLWS